MRIMKKISTFLVLTICIFGLSACPDDKETEEISFKNVGTKVTYEEFNESFLQKIIYLIGSEEEFVELPDFTYESTTYEYEESITDDLIQYTTNRKITSKHDSKLDIFNSKSEEYLIIETVNLDSNSEESSTEMKDRITDVQYQIEDNGDLVCINLNENNYKFVTQTSDANAHNAYFEFFNGWIGPDLDSEFTTLYINNTIYTIDYYVSDENRERVFKCQYEFDGNNVYKTVQGSSIESFQNMNEETITTNSNWTDISSMKFIKTDLNKIDINEYVLIES